MSASEDEDWYRKNVSLRKSHKDLIDSKALNFSQWVRNKLEEEYPEYFD